MAELPAAMPIMARRRRRLIGAARCPVIAVPSLVLVSAKDQFEMY
jgi:hypothetical protein